MTQSEVIELPGAASAHEPGVMTLFWGPGTCAIGIHLLLEELGRPYRTVELDVHGGATHTQAFLRINPKGKVPTLIREDGSVLTEFGAIATWLGFIDENRALLPSDAESGARIAETLAFVEGTIHGQGFGRIMRPDLFAPQDLLHGTLGVGQSSVKQQGQDLAEQGFQILAKQMGKDDFAIGNSFTIADAALFYVERWAQQYELKLPSALASHLARLRARPTVQIVEQQWHD